MEKTPSYNEKLINKSLWILEARKKTINTGNDASVEPIITAPNPLRCHVLREINVNGNVNFLGLVI